MLLAELRRERGLTLAQLCPLLGLSETSVGWLSDIENGKRDASLRLALSIQRWSGGRVTAASVNAEIRAAESGPDEPGLSAGGHGGEPCVDDTAVVAPGEDAGAENSDRNFSRTGVAA